MSTPYISNLSPSEYIRIHDIEDPVIQEWAYAVEDSENIHEKIEPTISEAKAQYPNEDFLEDIMSLVRQLNVKGANHELKNQILEALENRQTEIKNAAEYGIHELNGLLELF